MFNGWKISTNCGGRSGPPVLWIALPTGRSRPLTAIGELFPQGWNLAWLVLGDPPDGTFYFRNEPNLLDQFCKYRSLLLCDKAFRTARVPSSSAPPPPVCASARS